MKETVQQSAEKIWGIARDLASPSVSGTALNTERQVKHIASMLEAYALMHAQDSLVAIEVLKSAGYLEQIKNLKSEIKELKAKLDTNK